MQMCQNSAGIFCQNVAGSEQFRQKQNQTALSSIHTTNTSLIIERSTCTIKQSQDWLMPTVNPNIYLRDGITLVNLLHLICPLFSFVFLVANNLLRFSDNSSPSIERNKQLMAPKEIVTMTMSSFVTYLRIDASLVNSLCLLCPLYSFVLFLSLLRILVKISV